MAATRSSMTRASTGVACRGWSVSVLLGRSFVYGDGVVDLG
jgi:hypothetical protein